MYKAPSLLSLDGGCVGDEDGGKTKDRERGAKEASEVSEKGLKGETSPGSTDEKKDDAVKGDEEAEGKDPSVTEESSFAVTDRKDIVGYASLLNEPENKGSTHREATSRSVKLKRWMSMKAAKTVEYVSSNPHTPDNTDEGVILLDEPILMCQEINSFMGQHQTMLIREDEVQELKEQEIQAELEEQRQQRPSTLTASQSAEELDESGSRPTKSVPVSQMSSRKSKLFGGSRSMASVEPNLAHSESFSAVSDQLSSVGGREDDALLRGWNAPHRSDSTSEGCLETNKTASPVKTDSDDETTAIDSNNASTITNEEHVSEIAGRDGGDSVVEQKAEVRKVAEAGGECDDPAVEHVDEGVANEKPESIIGQAQGSEGSGTDGGDDGQEEDRELSPDDRQKEQPLVGYWSWENTYRVHKMKMHLGKGSDLCLHVCLAVLTNQLRYERNAVAVTV